MLAFEAAWTRALLSTGAVTQDDATKALQSIEAFDPSQTDTLAEGSNRDGLPVPALVKALRQGLADGPAQAIHTGATSQDIIDSAMALTLLAVTDKLATGLRSAISVLDDLRDRFGDAPMQARTRMQVALPATVSLRLAAWQRPLAEHLGRLDTVSNEISKAQIGGPIGLRDRPQGQGDAVAAEVARLLGLTPAPVWHTDRSGPVAMGHWLTLVTGTAGKIGQDMALMAQQGVDELRLSGTGGSSAMPHKQNPVLAESLVALARFTATQQAALAQAMIHEQERSGAAWSLEWLTLPAMCEATGTALRHLKTLLNSVDIMGE